METQNLSSLNTQIWQIHRQKETVKKDLADAKQDATYYQARVDEEAKSETIVVNHDSYAKQQLQEVKSKITSLERDLDKLENDISLAITEHNDKYKPTDLIQLSSLAMNPALSLIAQTSDSLLQVLQIEEEMPSRFYKEALLFLVKNSVTLTKENIEASGKWNQNLAKDYFSYLLREGKIEEAEAVLAKIEDPNSFSLQEGLSVLKSIFQKLSSAVKNDPNARYYRTRHQEIQRFATDKIKNCESKETHLEYIKLFLNHGAGDKAEEFINLYINKYHSGNSSNGALFYETILEAQNHKLEENEPQSVQKCIEQLFTIGSIPGNTKPAEKILSFVEEKIDTTQKEERNIENPISDKKAKNLYNSIPLFEQRNPTLSTDKLIKYLTNATAPSQSTAAENLLNYKLKQLHSQLRTENISAPRLLKGQYPETVTGKLEIIQALANTLPDRHMEKKLSFAASAALKILPYLPANMAGVFLKCVSEAFSEKIQHHALLKMAKTYAPEDNNSKRTKLSSPCAFFSKNNPDSQQNTRMAQEGAEEANPASKTKNCP